MMRWVLVFACLAALGCADETPVPLDATSRTRTSAPAPPPGPVVIEAVPARLDLGTVFVGTKPQATFQLINTSDAPVRVARCATTCKCTATDCPRNQDIAPGEAVTVTVTIDAEYPRLLSQRITVTFDGHAPVRVPVTVTVINYVSVHPGSMDPDGMPHGRFTLQSNDGRAFRVLTAAPALLSVIPSEPATTHELSVDWALWDRSDRLLRIDIDHPLVKRVQIELAPKPRDIRRSERAA